MARDVSRESEPQLPPATDEDKYPRFFWPINPTPAFGARRGWPHLDFLIVADRLDMYAAEARQFADWHTVRWQRFDLAHEK
jgi:hypothetical protein